jgi:hypothetical protein
VRDQVSHSYKTIYSGYNSKEERTLKWRNWNPSM